MSVKTKTIINNIIKNSPQDIKKRDASKLIKVDECTSIKLKPG